MSLENLPDYMTVNQLHDFFRILKQALEEERPEDPVEFIESFMARVPKPRLVIKGPPASGKGTQCERLVRQLNAVHISTGDILREEIKQGTEQGMQAEKFMEKGQLVPDELVIGLVKKRLMERDVETRGWILDGFPRTATQVRMMREEGIMPDCVIKLDVGDDVIVKRIGDRRIDPLTRKVYNIHSRPPPPGVEVIQRADDTLEAVTQRLHAYHSSLGEMLDEYTCPIYPVAGEDAESVGAKILMTYQKLRWSTLNRRSML